MELAVTVVIPTYNRGEALRETLTALFRCDYPADRYEVVVVDDGSTDGTGEVARQFLVEHPETFRYEVQPNAGPARARNRGAALARGRLLFFIDNDIVVQPDFMRRHREALAAHPGGWIVGRIRHPPRLRETPFGCYRDDLWEQFHAAHDPNAITETKGITAANLALPTDDFRALGGFDEAFTIASCEDWELGMRARRQGIRVLYDPGNVVLHNDWAVDLGKFCERQRLYSISDVLLWRMYGDASPRAAMIRQNAPESSSGAKGVAKRILNTGPGRMLLRAATKVSESISGDGAMTRKLYDAAIGAAISQGVREGLKRYPAEGRERSTNNHEFADTNNHE